MTRRLLVKLSPGGWDYYGPGTGYTGPHKLYRVEGGSAWYTTAARALRAREASTGPSGPVGRA